MQTTYVVSGMTRSHCVNSVHDEVSPIPGVTEVEVSLADGSVTATADQRVDERAVRAAVDEAAASAGVGQRPGPRA